MLTASPPPSPETFDKRKRDVLLALYRHPLSTEQLLRLNPTFTYPFPIRVIRRNGQRYRRSDVLLRLLKSLADDGQVRRPDRAAGRSPTIVEPPTYYITEQGFATLFPGRPVPKKASGSSTRQNSFFRPISPGMLQHEHAVAETMVHCLVQAERDRMQILACHTRNRAAFEIRGDYCLTQRSLRDQVQLHPRTGLPMNVTFFPDMLTTFRTSDGAEHTRAWELDGGTETVITDKDKESIVRKIHRYAHHHRNCAQDYRVVFLTFRRLSIQRLRNITACVREMLPPEDHHLFQFGTLDFFLAENGALTRPRLLDANGGPIACVNLP